MTPDEPTNNTQTIEAPDGVTPEDADELDLAGRLTELEHKHNQAVGALQLALLGMISLALVVGLMAYTRWRAAK